MSFSAWMWDRKELRLLYTLRADERRQCYNYGMSRRKKRRRRIWLLSLSAVLFLCLFLWHDYQAETKKKAWELMLVNSTHPIASDYEPALVALDNGEKVDERMYPYLQEMFDDARSEGIELYVRSGYRSYDEQKALYDSQVQAYLDQGYNEEEAEQQTLAYTAAPGTSEHETGLAVDINTADDNISGDTAQWLNENACDIGFIQRYASDKTDITGVLNEPWHYRYVGKKAAEVMTEKNLCLEEYLNEM